MTTEQAFIKLQIKYNETYQNSKIGIDRGRFVILFNEAQNKMIELILSKKGSDNQYNIQEILVPNKELLRKKKEEFYDVFPLPEDFFDFSSAYSKASKGDCVNQKIDLFNIKEDNKTEILQDEFNKPSFIARESCFSIASGNINVYKDGFTNDKLYFTYYRYPVQIKLISEDDPESNFNPDFNPEFDDAFTDRIISMVASELGINAGDQQFQLDRLRATEQL